MKNFVFKALLLSCFVMIGGGNLRLFAQSAFEQKLNSMGIIQDELEDLSNSSDIVLETPNCAYVNITGVTRMPWSKTETSSMDMHATVDVYDMNGHYFQKKVLLNAQGNSSMGFEKKNFAIDFCEDEWLGDKTTSITIGDWVTQDAFHFKAYYLDGFRGTANAGYKLYDQIVADHESYVERAGFENNGARCYPDGFPCIVYLNGDFYGVFAWNLKKHRTNMNHTKDNPNHIQLDGTLGSGNLWSGTITWNSFEVRNPKTLYTVDTEDVSGYIYTEITDNEEEIAAMGDNYTEAPSNPKDMDSEELDENSPLYYQYITSKGKIKYYKLTNQSGYAYKKYDGDAPLELIDATMPYYNANDKNHVLTAAVKQNVVALSKYYGELKAMENGGATMQDMRDALEDRFDITSLIDYIVFSAVTNNYDGFIKNWQWVTWDGRKWFVCPYDLDGTFGNFYTGTVMMTAITKNAEWNKFTSLAYDTHGPFYFICKYYLEDINERYLELRNNGVFSLENIMSHFRKWYYAVGSDNYNSEWAKWPNSPCNVETVVNANWSTIDDWTGYQSCENYNATKTYNAGDKCRYKTRIWTATGTTTGVAPCSKIGYHEDLQRVESWVTERLALADSYANLTYDDMQTSYTLNISAANWGTICVPFSFQIPAGVSVYSINSIDSDGAFIKRDVNNYTTANTPYLVHGPQGMYLLTGMKETPNIDVTSDATPEEVAEAMANSLKDGLLNGTLEDIYVPADNYVLQNHNGVLAFYHVDENNTISLMANRAYLTLPATNDPQLANARVINLFGDDETLDLESVATESDDRIVSIYNTNGVRLSDLGAGINIVKFADGRTVKVIKK